MFRIFFILLLFSFSISAIAQTRMLEMPVSIHADGISLEKVLANLTTSYSLRFSYSSSKIPIQTKVNLHVSNKSLNEVLLLLGKQCNFDFHVVGEQIVLVENVSKENVLSQPTYSISGFVSDSLTGERLIGATIVVRSLEKGTVTNSYGYFSLSLPEGDYELSCSFIGYKTQKNIFRCNRNQSFSFLLQPQITSIKEVTFNSRTFDKLALFTPGRDQLSMPMLKSYPALLGENDVIQYLKMLPGIQNGTEASTGLYVRGSLPGQTTYLIDDAPLYNISHISGLFSSINPEALKDVQIYKSHIPSKMAGSLASVVDLRLRDGDNQHYSVSGGLGTISSRISIEGPIIPNKASFIISARRSYIDQLVKLFTTDKEIKSYRFYFYDIHAKMNYTLNAKNKLYVSGYRGEDIFMTTTGTRWGNNIFSLRWNQILTGRIFANLTLNTSNYYHQFLGQSNGTITLSSGIKNYSVKYDLSFYASPSYQLDFGLNSSLQQNSPPSVEGNSEEAQVKNIKNNIVKRSLSSMYVSNKIRLTNKLGAEASLCLWMVDPVKQKNAQSIIAPEPLLSMRYRFTPVLSGKIAWSRNYQFHHTVPILDMFIPFERILFSDNTLKPQWANQFSGGVDYRNEENGWEFSAEGYFKKMHNQYRFRTDYNFLIDSLYYKYQEKGIMNAWGVEFFTRKTLGRFSGSLSYTLSFVKDRMQFQNKTIEYYALHDRRHDFSLSTQYELTRRTKLMLSWIYMSGSPYNEPVGKYTVLGQVLPLYNLNGLTLQRMVPYHRLDLGAKTLLSQGRFGSHSLSLCVYNVYFRKNPLFYSFTQKNNKEGKTEFVMRRMYLFQFVPSFSYEFLFK